MKKENSKMLETNYKRTYRTLILKQTKNKKRQTEANFM